MEGRKYIHVISKCHQRLADSAPMKDVKNFRSNVARRVVCIRAGKLNMESTSKRRSGRIQGASVLHISETSPAEEIPVPPSRITLQAWFRLISDVCKCSVLASDLLPHLNVHITNTCP